MDFKNSYFKLLPNEILIKILENVEIFDSLRFSEAYNDFLRNNALITNVNLCLEYKVADLKTIYNRADLSCITTLNINCLYWISGNDLRSLLSKSTNLRVLLAIDTALDLKEDDFNIYSRLKLKKLAITVRETEITTKIPLITVETLLMKLLVKVVIPWQLFPALKSLWCEDTTDIVHGLTNTKIKKLLARTYTVPIVDHFDRYHYKTYRSHHLPTLFFDDVQLTKIDMNCWPEEWQKLESYLRDYPFPYRTLYTLKEKNISEIMFDELHLRHQDHLSMSSNKIYKRILSSNCTKQLKKLSISLCLLPCDHLEDRKTSDAIVFNKRQHGLDEMCPFFEKHFLYNCKSLQVLELYLCDTRWGSILKQQQLRHGFLILCHLKHLKYLSIQMPYIDGKFLINILNNCQQLEALKIDDSVFSNNELAVHLCKALENAHNLKDFRLFSTTTSISQILNIFCDKEKSKLQRISLICDNINETDYDRILEKFLESNPQLIFMFLQFRICPVEKFETIKRIFAKFAHQQAARCYAMEVQSPYQEYNMNMPQIHFLEMVVGHSIISNPDPYVDFIDF